MENGNDYDNQQNNLTPKIADMIMMTNPQWGPSGKVAKSIIDT